MSSWYEKCMPKIKDVKPYLYQELERFKNVDGVKSIYVWGSYADNIDNLNFRLKDIDILARTRFDSGDLISVDNKIVKDMCSDSYLENQGYDPSAVKFSKELLKLAKYNIDCWAISSDRKLLHWGPISDNKKESENISKEAENYAFNLTGIKSSKINKTSETNRKNWYNHYCNYINRYYEGMPTGWYKTEDIKVKDVLAKAIKI